MRIWHEKLIKKLCQRHLCAVWREGLGAYKIITEHKKCSYAKHPATLEFTNCPEALWHRLKLIRAEAISRGYNFKELPPYVEFGGHVKQWQTLKQQTDLIKAKKCICFQTKKQSRVK